MYRKAPGKGAKSVLLVAGLLFGSLVHAQGVSRPEQIPGQQAQDTEAAADATRKAAEKRPLEVDGEITFEQILDNPDDPEINFRFAKAEIGRGNLRSAAATLERVLMVAPERLDVRLVYAIVLFRLDNTQESEREFRTIAAQDLPDDIRADVDAYLREIALREKRTRYTVDLAVGVQYDTNRNAGPSQGQILVAGVPVNIQGTILDEEDDSALVIIGSARALHDLDHPHGDKLFGSLTYFHSDQTNLDTFDLQSLIIEGGRQLNYAFGSVSPSLIGQTVAQSKQTYMRSIGGQVRVDQDVTRDIALFVRARLDDEDFRAIKEDPLGDLQDGVKSDVVLGTTVRHNPKLYSNASVTMRFKNAKADFRGYRGPRANVNFTWLVGQGRFLQMSGDWAHESYQGIDPFTDPTRIRSDQQWRFRVAHGIPFDYFVGRQNLPGIAQDMSMTLSFEYFSNRSNIQNFTYDNQKFNLQVNKRWDF